ncbi:MAG: DUF362 domain-containing protein [Candidatus Zixiibacteriota bacterium]
MGLSTFRSNWLFAQDEIPAPVDLAVAVNGSPKELVRSVIASLGGMNRFVSKGDVVVVKPNIAWDRSPEQAANSNPQVVAEIVKLCFQAGAKKVRVFDRTCNKPWRTYRNSGIKEAAERVGAEVSYTSDPGFAKVDMPENKLLRSWELYKPALDCDCLINVPIAKQHATSELTLGMKNLMGIMGGDRGQIHWRIHDYLPELAHFIRPKLTVIDAVRILVANGPQGGSLKDVRRIDTVVAGPYIASADAYAATLFGKNPTDLGFITNGHKLGLGEIDLEKLNLARVDLS